MAKITGTGAPTSKTQAAVGDIYTDTTNGKQYKCKCAYKSNTEKMYVSYWAPLDMPNQEPQSGNNENKSVRPHNHNK